MKFVRGLDKYSFSVMVFSYSIFLKLGFHDKVTDHGSVAIWMTFYRELPRPAFQLLLMWQFAAKLFKLSFCQELPAHGRGIELAE
jgi:hypothetical protein